MASSTTRNKLYYGILIACLAGYIWIFFYHYYYVTNNDAGVVTCIIKKTTGVPCPSCGITRSISSFIHTTSVKSLFYNPLSILVMAIIIISPPWIIIDMVTKKDTFYRFYKKMENILTIRYIAVIAILLIIANWIWNIQKGL